MQQTPVGFNYSSPFRLFCLSAASPRKNEGHRPIHCTKQRKGTRQHTMHMFDLLGLGNDVPCTCLIRWGWATKCQQMLHNRTQWLTGELKLSIESATVHSQLLRRDFVFQGKAKVNSAWAAELLNKRLDTPSHFIHCAMGNPHCQFRAPGLL